LKYNIFAMYQLKEEAHRDKELGDESLRAAMSKLTEIIQQHEKETARRKALERTMEHLQFEFEDEKKRLATRSAVELRKRRAEWEEERSSLLTIIQRECNSVFERKKNNFAHDQQQRSMSSREEGDIGASSVAPLLVDTSRGDSLGDLPGKDPSPLNVVGSARSTTSTARLISPTFSDFDSVLRETEELVQGLF
jgi:hypothetical protein